MLALEAAVDRRAPETQNPVQPTDANLVAGMKIYQSNCTSCYGDIQHSHAVLGNALFPRAPPFAQDAQDMPENRTSTSSSTASASAECRAGRQY